jgi:hypothetical protein
MVGSVPFNFSGRAAASWYSGDSDRLRNVAQCIFGNEPVPGLTENQADTWLVVWMAEEFVHRRMLLTKSAYAEAVTARFQGKPTMNVTLHIPDSVARRLRIPEGESGRASPGGTL